MNNKEMENVTMKDIEESELKFEELAKVSGGREKTEGDWALEAFQVWKEKMEKKYDGRAFYKMNKEDRETYMKLYVNYAKIVNFRVR